MDLELRRHKFNLIIADLNMPSRTSTSVIRHGVVQNQTEPELGVFGVPVLVITGLDAEDAEFQKARRLPNVVGIMRKPLDFPALRRRVDELLSAESGREAPRIADPTFHVLLLDDSADVHAAISSALEGAGCQVRCCGTAAEALWLCQRHRFHVLLINFMLEDGYANNFLESLLRSVSPERVPATFVLSDLGEALTLDHFRRFPQVRGILSRDMGSIGLQKALRGVGWRPPACAPSPFAAVPA
jgi:CheY-like chemotaxis protein